MKKTTRLISILVCVLLVVCVAGMLVSCTKKAAPAAAAASSGNLRVAVILKTLSSPYWQTVLDGAKKAGTELGITIDAFGPPTEDGVEEQINMVQNAINSKYDAIVFSPCQPPAAIPVLGQAKAAGIPVVVIDTPMPESFTDYVTYIGSNNFQIGVEGANALIAATPNKAAVVMVIEGAPGNPSTTQRADGVIDTFTKAGYKVFDRQPGYSDRQQALNVMQNALQRQKTFDIVFCSNDDMAEGAYRALSQAGVKALVMGVDGNQSAKESVRDDGLFGTVAQDAAGMGELGVKNAIEYIKGNRNIPKKIDAPSPVITKANVAQYLN
jgi:ribose transport system substrate-binding protein